MRLLLLSNSTLPGEPYLGWPREHLARFLAGVRRLAFAPYAGVRVSWDDYAARVQAALDPLGVELRPLHRAADPAALVAESDAVAVGGGNTFHLLDRLARGGLLAPIRAAVRAGLPYVGWSAGSVVACPSLATTNDMPIVEPPAFAALGLVPFQINAHYTEAVLPDHGGETRRERLEEFLAVNPALRVVGLREGSALLVEGAAGEACVTLLGQHPATVFAHGRAPAEWAAGETIALDDLRLSSRA